MTPCRRRRSVRRQRQLWISQTKDGLGGRCIAFSSSFRFPLERSFFASSISIGTKEGKEGGPEGRKETQPADRRQDGGRSSENAIEAARRREEQRGKKRGTDSAKSSRRKVGATEAQKRGISPTTLEGGMNNMKH